LEGGFFSLAVGLFVCFVDEVVFDSVVCFFVLLVDVSSLEEESVVLLVEVSFSVVDSVELFVSLVEDSMVLLDCVCVSEVDSPEFDSQVLVLDSMVLLD
jgi:hypothetical protein